MKNKKVLIYYLLEFILTFLIFLTIIVLILKITILNKKYLISKLEQTNYYHELYEDINNDFENYIMQSGFDNSITNDLFTEEDLKKVVNNNVDNFYKGKDFVVQTDNLKNKLESNINNYLDEIKITITDNESLDLFINEIEKIYKNRIILNKEITKVSSIFYKVNNIVNIFLIILCIVDSTLFILIKKLFKKITLTIPILSSMILLLICYYVLFSSININSIMFWNVYVSNVIKLIFKELANVIKYISIIGIILELIKLLIFYIKNKKFREI